MTYTLEQLAKDLKSLDGKLKDLERLNILELSEMKLITQLYLTKKIQLYSKYLDLQNYKK